MSLSMSQLSISLLLNIMRMENQPTNLEERPVSQPVFEQRIYVTLLSRVSILIMDFNFTASYIL
jgi:hypothetical protein